MIALLIAAFVIRIYLIDLPGPYGDETIVVLPAYQLRWGGFASADAAVLFGRRVPLAVGPHTGALPLYAQFAFSYLAGKHWSHFRILDIFYAVATVAVTYFLTRDLFGRHAALMTAALLAFAPSSVFYSRLGETVVFLRVLLSTLVVFLGYRWWRTDRWGYFYGMCLSLGLGLSTRIEIVWWMLASALYLLLLNRSALSAMLGRVRGHGLQALGGAGLFLGGAAPFLVYNVHSRAGTLAEVVRNLSTTFYGHRNFAFPQNFQKRLLDLTVLLNGSDRSFVAYFGPVFRNDLVPIMFFGCFLLLLAASISGRRRGRPARQTEFLVLTTLLMLGLSTFTVSVLAPYQLLIMMPLPLLVIVHAVSSWRLSVVGAIMIAVLLVGDLAVDARYYRSLQRTGGVGLFSSGIFDLARHLQGHGPDGILVCDWGILSPLEFISQEKIGGREIFGYDTGPDRTSPVFYEELRRASQHPDSLYVFHAPPYEQYKRHEAFLDYLKASGFSYERAILSDRNGPTYYVYRSTRRAARWEPP